MDNRVFNVNGRGLERLTVVLELAMHDGHSNKKAKGWRFNRDHGIILLWAVTDTDHKFLTPLSAIEIAPIIMTWLDSEEADTVILTGWDEDFDHDGENSKGWRVYCEDWGHVDGDYKAICAITPAYMWHGK